ncbi:MAG: tetratricopeptide repeat protein [Calditrichaeota bacterium]|nr:MAG: tetratricopeptide repeat protein [Calditrichota bacterium]
MKKIKLILIFGLVFLCSNFAFGNEIENYFKQGNELYTQGNFEDALGNYLKISNSEVESFELFYNIGNCYYRLNQIGNAIRFYEKAKNINPEDENLLYNLKLANNLTIDKIELPEPDSFTKFVNSSLQFFTVSELAYIFVGLTWVFAIFLVLFIFKRNKLFLYISLAFLGFVVLEGIFFNYKYSLDTIPYGVVVGYEANAYSSPNKDSQVVFSIHEGTKAQILRKTGEFLEVRLIDGKTGWVLSGLFGKI